MDQRPLGRTGKTLSALGLGTVTFGREIDEETSYRIMDFAIEKGITWFDTSEAYGGGQSRQHRSRNMGIDDAREVSDEISSSECIIGRWLKKTGVRDRITLCSKVLRGGRAEKIEEALSASLDRLDTDRLEIYKMHKPDLETPIEETLDALNTQVGKGRIQILGCANYSKLQVTEALEVSKRKGYARFEIVQNPYNLVRFDQVTELLALCRKEQIALTPFSPLAEGFLTGKYAKGSEVPKGSRFDINPGFTKKYFTDEKFRVVENLRREAERREVPMVRLAVAWALTNPELTSTIVGARTVAHVENALSALEMELDLVDRERMQGWLHAG